MKKKEKKAKRRCLPAETISCTSSLFHGNLFLPLFLQQLFITDTLLLSSPSSSLVPALLSLVILPVILAASFSSRTVSTLSPLSPWELLYLIPSPPRPPLLKTRLPTLPWVM